MEEKKKILSPVLKVQGRDLGHYGAWKAWWSAWGVGSALTTHRARSVCTPIRAEGPAIIYQDGRVRWRQP